MPKYNDFETILDECLEMLLAGNGTVDQCLQRYPEHAVELEPLLRTALSVNRAINIQPSPEFKKRAHLQLQLKMAEQQKCRRVSFFSAQPRWALAALGVMVVFLLGTGTVFAANSSMPDSPLYPVKLATENARITLTGSDVQKEELYATYADRRLTEMSRMAEKGKNTRVEAVAKRFNEEVTRMVNVPLAKNSGEEDNPRVISAVPAAAPVPSATPATPSVLSLAPPPMMGKAGERTAQPPSKVDSSEKTVVTATGAGSQINATSVGSNQAASSKNAPKLTDKEKLKQTITYYAKMHPEQLRKLLESNKIPEAVKPAILRALNASENGYQQALKDLGN